MQRTLLGLAVAAVLTFPSFAHAQGFGRSVGIGYGAGYHAGTSNSGGWGSWGGYGAYGWGSNDGGYGGCNSNCCDNVWAGYGSRHGHGFGGGCGNAWSDYGSRHGHGFGHFGGGCGGHIRQVGPGCCGCPSNGCGCNGGNAGYRDVSSPIFGEAMENSHDDDFSRREEVASPKEEKSNLEEPAPATDAERALDFDKDEAL